MHVDFWLQEPSAGTDTMRCSLRHCLLTSLAVGFLWLFLTLQIPRDMDEDQNVKAKLLSEGTEGMGGRRGVDRQTLKVPVPVHLRALSSKGGRGWTGTCWSIKKPHPPFPSPLHGLRGERQQILLEPGSLGQWSDVLRVHWAHLGDPLPLSFPPPPPREKLWDAPELTLVLLLKEGPCFAFVDAPGQLRREEGPETTSRLAGPHLHVHENDPAEKEE